MFPLPRSQHEFPTQEGSFISKKTWLNCLEHVNTYLSQMVVWWWFTTVQSQKQHLEQIPKINPSKKNMLKAHVVFVESMKPTTPFWSNGAVDARHGSRGGGALRGQGAQDITVTVRWAHDGAGKPAGNKNWNLRGLMIRAYQPLVALNKAGC